MAKRALKHSGLWFVVTLLGVLLALWWGLGFADQYRQRQITDEEIDRILDERGEETDAEDMTGDVPGAEVGGTRAETITSVEADAENLLPGDAESGDITRFWFSTDTELYVEYTSDGEARMAFLAEVDGELARLATYAQSDSGAWELLEGEEVLFTKPLRDLYERDSNGNWVSRN